MYTRVCTSSRTTAAFSHIPCKGRYDRFEQRCHRERVSTPSLRRRRPERMQTGSRITRALDGLDKREPASCRRHSGVAPAGHVRGRLACSSGIAITRIAICEAAPPAPRGRSADRATVCCRTSVPESEGPKGATSGCCASEALHSGSYRPVSTVVVSITTGRRITGGMMKQFGTPRTKKHAIPFGLDLAQCSSISVAARCSVRDEN